MVHEREEELLKKEMTNDRVKELIHIIRTYETKLLELMGDKDFWEFNLELAKECFKADIDSMDDGEFKQFCLDIFKKIVGEEKWED